jgi:hypothetical protein
MSCKYVLKRKTESHEKIAMRASTEMATAPQFDVNIKKTTI